MLWTLDALCDFCFRPAEAAPSLHCGTFWFTHCALMPPILDKEQQQGLAESTLRLFLLTISNWHACSHHSWHRWLTFNVLHQFHSREELRYYTQVSSDLLLTTSSTVVLCQPSKPQGCHTSGSNIKYTSEEELFRASMATHVPYVLQGDDLVH